MSKPEYSYEKTLNVYQKLNAARDKFHSQELKKSGHNKFAGYQYFELGDFVVPALAIFKEVGLTSVISFGADQAVMKIINTDKPEETIEITSPMSEANLKGCHPVQNLGAVQTYTRRYLWVAALEIVEHDAIDSNEPVKQEAKPAKKDTLTNARFATAVERIKDGKYTTDKLRETFALTEEQEAALIGALAND